MSECLLYYVNEGFTTLVLTPTPPKWLCNCHVWYAVCRCGQGGNIQLSGQFILDEHCSFENEGGESLKYFANTIIWKGTHIGKYNITTCNINIFGYLW